MTEKEGESSTKLAGLIERSAKLGLKVKESSVGSIGFVGGVRRPEAKSVDDNNRTGSPKPSGN